MREPRSQETIRKISLGAFATALFLVAVGWTYGGLTRTNRLGLGIQMTFIDLFALAALAGTLSRGTLERALGFFRAPVLRYLGKRSYFLYLIHLPAAAACERLTGYQSPILSVALAFATSCLLAELSGRWVEDPILSLKALLRPAAPKGARDARPRKRAA